MASYEDWWGFLIFVFFVLAIAMCVIKILIEYPGLMEWKLVYSDSTENLIEDTEHDDIELSDITREVTKERDKEHKSEEKTQNKINDLQPFPSNRTVQHSEDKQSLLINIELPSKS